MEGKEDRYISRSFPTDSSKLFIPPAMMRMFVLIDNKELSMEFELLDYLRNGEIVLDSINCLSDGLSRQLHSHGFNENEDRIIFKQTINSSVNIFKFIQMNLSHIARVHSTKGHKRKIIVKEDKLDEFLQLLKEFVNISHKSLEPKISPVQIEKYMTKIINDRLIEKIHENKYTKIFHNHSYRDFQFRDREILVQLKNPNDLQFLVDIDLELIIKTIIDKFKFK